MNEESLVKKPWVVVVGGFLGSGKTTLLLAAATELQRRGLRSAVILNDQGDRLVDTSYAAIANIHTGEVTGGCFCCRLSDLMQVIEDLCAYAPDVILAEPVGSCADIAATVLRPLQEYSDSLRLAPFTVLVDPLRARMLLEQNADADMRFLFEKQLQEADLVCFTKSDLSLSCPAIPAAHVRQLSAKTGQGVAAWLNEILSGSITAASHALDIDYDHYARAEAALAWLNLQAKYQPREPVSPAFALGPFFDAIDTALTSAGISIMHLKGIASGATGFVKAAICANEQEPEIEGNLDASPADSLELLVNLRAIGAPDQVQAIIEAQLSQLHEITQREITCFSPAAPVPQKRIVR